MSDTADSFVIAGIQLCSGVEPEHNIAQIDQLVGEAAQAGATYVLTPEVSVAFAANRAGLMAVALAFEGNPHIAALADIAKKHSVHLHIGSMAIARPDSKFFNRALLFGPEGALMAQYDKIHLFDADPPNDRPYRESDTYVGGDKAVVDDSPGFGLGFSICYDLRFPALFAALVEGGAKVLAIPAAFTVPTGKAHWEVLLRARAIETGSYVIAAAQGGIHANGRETFGHSMIIDPWGRIVARCMDDASGVIIAEIDLKQVDEARARLPVLANRGNFSLSVNHNVP